MRYPRAFFALIPTLLFLFLFPQTTFAHEEKKEKGTLAQFEEEVDKGSDKHKHDGDNGNGDDDDGTNSLEDAAIELAAHILWEIRWAFIGPLFGFPVENVQHYDGTFWHRKFTPYPYSGSRDGLFSETEGKPMALDVSGYYFLHDSDLTGIGFRGRLSPSPVFNLEVNYVELSEQLMTRVDNLTVYNLLVNYYRVRLNDWTLWWGLGIKGLHGESTHNGFAFDVGTEIYPQRPFSFYLNYTGGFLNSTYVPEFYGALNLHLNRFAVFVGYQWWSARSADITGLVAGLKINF